MTDREANVLKEHSGLVWSIVHRYQGRGVETDDLYQLGCIGLLKAARGFDPQYGTQFSTYAVPKIAGEIRRYLRDDGPVKVSRTLQEQSFRLRQAQEDLERKSGRSITVSELAAHVGLSIEETAAALQSAQPVQSLECPTGESDFCLLDTLSSGSSEEDITTRISLQQAISKLPSRLAQVIAMRYGREMTQQQTARVLGVSQVQISRLEHKAVDLLRQELIS